MSDQQIFAALSDVLERERDLLQTGRAAEAAGLIEEKLAALQNFEALVESRRLGGASLETRRAIERIIQMAEENASHMEAIRNGIRRAIQRLERLNTGAQVGSYGRGGAQLSFSNATGTFSRKA
ncbi:MAG: hypothetical protein ACK4N1_01590 [Pseudorhizobium sp.]